MKSFCNIFNLVYNQEYNYWQNNIIEKFKGKKNSNSITNPIKLICSKKKCRKLLT